MGERIWLRHKETGGFFHAPTEVVDTFKDRGWEPADEPPAEPNPVVEERISWEQERAARAETTPPDKAETTTNKPRRGTTEKEG